jgi:diguanylate cyclase (GGDEF)-like protein
MGLRFRCEIGPADNFPYPMEAPQRPSRPRHPPRDTPVVLLGIAEHALRLELRDALEAGGLVVSESTDMESCLDAFNRLEPEVVIVGSMSADIDAPRMCSALHHRAGTRRTPVIVLVDPNDANAIQRAYDSGASDFLVHPVDAPLVAHRVHFALRNACTSGEAVRTGPSAFAGAGVLADVDELLAQLRAAMAQAKATRRHVALLSVDLNRFRSISASLSHTHCEQLLADVAQRLRVGIRSNDLLAILDCNRADISIARTGGDEFCLLLRDVKEAKDIARVAQRIVDLMAEPFRVDGNDTVLTISIGIASYPSDDLPAEELLKSAEKAAYSARQDGSSSLTFYSTGMDVRAMERLSLEVSLRRAVERNELVLHYQPRVEVKTGRIVGVEALVRWNHPELGRISPLEFIPLAEETGLIVPIGEWILRAACEQNKRWQNAGIAPVRMAVNLSAVQFRQRDLYESVTRTLAATGLDPRWLEFELTESLLMRDAESGVKLLERFKSLGMQLSIDDFGTGYSSLSYLKRFPIDALKVDQSFVREMTSSSDDAALVTAIILMGRSLRLRVVAEGVETRSQLGLLRILQCDEIQGYLVSRPVEADDMATLLTGAVPAAFAA